MRDFLIAGEELLDEEMIRFLKNKAEHIFFSCKWIRYNEKIKVFYFTEGYRSLGAVCGNYALEDACSAIKHLLMVVKEIEKYPEIAKENIIWDVENIYVDEKNNIRMICLPVKSTRDAETENIYKKQIYSLVEDLLNRSAEGNLLYRRVLFLEEKSFGDWDAVMQTMEGDILQDESVIFLERTDLEGDTIPFPITNEEIYIGSDPDICQLTLTAEGVAPQHARVGWNDINFYVMDLDTEAGIFVNGTRIAAGIQVPIARGNKIGIGQAEFLIV